MTGGELFALIDWKDVARTAPPLAVAFVALGALAMLTQRERRTGYQLGEEFTADVGVVEIWDGRMGYVRVGGELWKAEAKTPLAPGTAVKVARKDGMLLRVAPL
ncbi:MAG: NfeD family protein [Parvularculaceae bacterium]